MADQSHREEMNAAIRAQRERQAVPRTIAPEPPPEPPPAASHGDTAAPKGLLRRLLGK
jgi:hypothetical protein